MWVQEPQHLGHLFLFPGLSKEQHGKWGSWNLNWSSYRMLATQVTALQAVSWCWSLKPVALEGSMWFNDFLGAQKISSPWGLAEVMTTNDLKFIISIRISHIKIYLKWVYTNKYIHLQAGIYKATIKVTHVVLLMTASTERCVLWWY